MKRWITYRRRRWCHWRNHPMAAWSPIVIYDIAPDRMMEDGTILKGEEYIVRAWRCSFHDKVENG